MDGMIGKSRVIDSDDMKEDDTVRSGESSEDGDNIDSDGINYFKYFLENLCEKLFIFHHPKS